MPDPVTALGIATAAQVAGQTAGAATNRFFDWATSGLSKHQLNEHNKAVRHRLQKLLKGKEPVAPETINYYLNQMTPQYRDRKLSELENMSKYKKYRQERPEYAKVFDVLKADQANRAGFQIPEGQPGATQQQAFIDRGIAPAPIQAQAQSGGGGGGAAGNYPPGSPYAPRRMGGEGNLWSGYGSTVEQFPIFTEQQHGIMNRLLPQAAQGIESFKEGFAPIEQKARTDYLNKTIPSIAERFTQSGGRGSSGFRNALGESAQGLETNIAELGSRYNLERQGLLQNLLKSLIQPSYESFYSPSHPGVGEVLAAAAPGFLRQAGERGVDLFSDWASKRIAGKQPGGPTEPPPPEGGATGFQPYQGPLTQPGSYQPGQPVSAVSPQQSLLNTPVTSASFAGQPYQPQGLGPTGFTQSSPTTPQGLAGRMRNLTVGGNFRPKGLL